MHSEHDDRAAEPLDAAATGQPLDSGGSAERHDDATADDAEPTAPQNEPTVDDEIPELSLADSVEDPTESDRERDAAALSPSVRRLVRQYDLDITGIHGSGPAGRIKVGDVIALLGNRGEPGQSRSNDAARTLAAVEDGIEDRARTTPYRGTGPAARAPVSEPALATATVATTVFECDLTRVLAQRKLRRLTPLDVALASYCLVACGEALRLVPEAAPAGRALGIVSSAADGQVRTVVVDAEQEVALGSIEDRLLALDRALRARDACADLDRAGLVLHHHGLAGSLIATPTPIGASQAASLGLGRVRKQLVVRTIDGEDAPRVAALGYVSLSFLPDRLDLPRANRFLAHFVRVLEHWPD